MLPEFTCGKTILPACSHFTALLPHLWAKSGTTMLPTRGKTMSKVTQKCNFTHNASKAHISEMAQTNNPAKQAKTFWPFVQQTLSSKALSL
jgi:hypothetical protein